LKAKAADEFASGKRQGSKRKSGAAEEDEGAALVKLVEGHEDLEFYRDGSKVRCKSTKHEMPAVLMQVREFISGPKYLKYKSMYSIDFSMHEPYIIRHQYKNKFLYCTLTKTTLPMDPKKVEKHVSSVKYKAGVAESEARDARRKAKMQKRRLQNRRPKVAGEEEGPAKLEKKVNGKFLAKKKKKLQGNAAAQVGGDKVKIKDAESKAPAKDEAPDRQGNTKKRRREEDKAPKKVEPPAKASVAPEEQPKKKKKKGKA